MRLRNLEVTLEHGRKQLLLRNLHGGSDVRQQRRCKVVAQRPAPMAHAVPAEHEARTMLQVRIEDVAEADDIFTKLMGDVVEPRREFIQQNALNVENLDT